MVAPEAKAKYDERWNRMEVTLKGGKPADRLPVIIYGDIPCAKLADPSIVTSDKVFRQEYYLDKAYEGLEILKDVDSINAFFAGYSKASGLFLMSNVKIPGIDIGKDDILQIDEHPHMDFEDYKTILEKGWNAFSADYAANRLNITKEDIESGRPFMQSNMARNEKAGYVAFSGTPHPVGWDTLSAMRGMSSFFRDLRKDPQMIKDTLAVMCEEGWDNYIAALKKNAENRDTFCCMVQPGVRANCDFVSRKQYEEFVWPYAQKFTYAVLDTGNNVHFHYDAKWDAFLDLYTEFPKGRCIFDSDGVTDIYKVKEILGQTMAIEANVSAAMLAIGTPDEVYNYTVKQINDIGPNGFYVCSACTIPSNCKPENLKAMVAAARA